MLWFLFLPFYVFRAKHVVEAGLALLLVIPFCITIMIIGPVMVLMGPTSSIETQKPLAPKKDCPLCTPKPWLA